MMVSHRIGKTGRPADSLRGKGLLSGRDVKGECVSMTREFIEDVLVSWVLQVKKSCTLAGAGP